MSANLRCAIAHRGISRFRIAALTRGLRNDDHLLWEHSAARTNPSLAAVDLATHQRDGLLIDPCGIPGLDGREVGQTQFLPKNIAAYGTGNLDNAANALNSTANFLRAHGWRAGAGYQPGEPNFAAIEAWNAAGVYQKAIALMGRQIDGGE